MKPLAVAAVTATALAAALLLAVLPMLFPAPAGPSLDPHAAFIQAATATPRPDASTLLPLAQARAAYLRSLSESDPATALDACVSLDDAPQAAWLRDSAILAPYLETLVSGPGAVEMVSAFSGQGSAAHDHLTIVFDGPPRVALASQAATDARWSPSSSSSNLAFKTFTFGRRAAIPQPHSDTLWGAALPAMSPLSPVLFLLAPSPLRIIPSTLSYFAGLRFTTAASPAALQSAVDAALAAESSAATLAPAFISDSTMQSLKTLVLIVRCADETAAPSSIAAFTVLMRTCSRFWAANSYGCADLDTTFTPLLTLPKTRGAYSSGGNCPISTVASASSALDNDAWAAAAGFTESNYDRYLIVFNGFEECTWLGLGQVAGSAVWINGAVDPVLEWYVSAHELGHNFGLKHANLWVTTDGLTAGGPGDSQPYLDDFDVMGGIAIEASDRFPFHANAEKKSGLGWIPSADIATATTAACTAAPCRFKVHAHDLPASGSGTRVVRVLQSGSRWYWFSHRQTIAYLPAAAAFASGLQAHYVDDLGATAYERETNLLDMTAAFVPTADPAYSNATDNSPLQIGYSYTDTVYGITVSSLAVGSTAQGQSWIEAAVYLGAANGAPSLDSLATASGCAAQAPGQALALIATASDPDSDPLLYGWAFGDGTYSAESAATVTHVFASAGTYRVTATVSDQRGGTASRTLSITVGGSGCACTATSSCGGNGVCAADLCRCAGNYTGAACAQSLQVASVAPAFTPVLTGASPGTSITVTTSAAVFSADSTPLCWFVGLATVTGSVASATAVTCPLPAGPTTLTAYTLEVSPNAGADWSDSRATFTYGACPSCSGHGACVPATGACDCDVGYTGAGCASPVVVASLSPALGPQTGDTLLTLSGTGFGTGALPCADILVAFTAGTSTVTVQGRLVGATIVLSTPAIASVPAAGLVTTVSVSPNRGVDWSAQSVGTFTFAPVEPLFDGLTVSDSVANSGDFNYYSIFYGDSDAAVTLTLTGSDSAQHPQLIVGRGAAPSTTRCSDGTVDCSLLAYTYAAGSSYVGRYILQAGTSDVVGPVAYTLGGAVAGGTVLRITPDAEAAQSGYVTAGADRQYRLLHAGAGVATVLTLTSADAAPAPPVSFALAKTASPSSATPGALTGTSAVVQACVVRTDYYLSVAGSGARFYLSATTAAVPVLPTPLPTASSTFSSVTVNWLAAKPTASTAKNAFTYLVFYKSSGDSAFNSSCGARSAGRLVTTITGSDAASFSAKISGLKPALSYDVIVIARDSAGIETSYTRVTKRTIPSSIPTKVLLAIGLACAALLLLCCLGFYCYRRRAGRKAGSSATNPNTKARAVGVQTVQARAKSAWSAGGKGEMSFKRGEVVVLLGKPSKGWILARNGSGKQGYVPFSYFAVQSGAEKAYAGRSSSRRGSRSSNRA